MSSSKARNAASPNIGVLNSSPRSGLLRRHPRLLALAVLAAVAPALSACGNGGFKPLYATNSYGVNVSDKLAQVKVAPIPGRVGQRIRNELIYETTGGGRTQKANYRLEVAVRETVSTTIVQRTGESKSHVYNLDASFRLIRIADNTVVLQGKSYGRAGFERFESIFSNVRARKDAEDRAAQTVGTELKTRLASFLATT